LTRNAKLAAAICSDPHDRQLGFQLLAWLRGAGPGCIESSVLCDFLDALGRREHA
jgi:hypothetical protein